MDQQFYAGSRMVEITPESGLQMDGYMARAGNSTGVHDPLMAAVLVLEYSGRFAALLTLDVMAVSKSFTETVRSDLADLLGTSRDAILICASHTHSGPSGLQDWFPIGSASLDKSLVESVRLLIMKAAAEAKDRRRSVKIRFAEETISGIGGDRNHRERIIDSSVSILVFEAANNHPEAILFHFACHPTILGAENLEYSADFPGAARRRIKERYPDAVCLFVNGAAGNISTRFLRRDQSFAEVDRIGHLLGDKVVELIGEAAYDVPDLLWLCETLSLPLRTFPAESRKVEPSGETRIDTVISQGLNIEAALVKKLQGLESYHAEICALRIGSRTLLTVPGEAFDDLASGIRQVSPHALVVGYANDYLGYFPTQASISAGTYEALSSPYDARAHLQLQEQLINLFQRMQAV